MSHPSKPRLSAQQQTVVDFVQGPLLVIAGPGSGKTRVLTERVRALLTNVEGHFRILVLTFTNKAAEEMKERLLDLGDERQRAFVGTLHGFCLDVLAERGSLVGVDGAPNIFEQTKDRREVLRKAIHDDPVLQEELDQAPDPKARAQRVDHWLQMISRIKSHPISYAVIEDDLERRVVECYEAGMRSCNAFDFDDLLLLTYKLLSENPKLANFYHRLYRFICVDEAQDLNEAQYAVISALANPDANVMLVGDPKQSIYGFNSSSPHYMESFATEFKAKRVELTENFRSSKAIVEMARMLDDTYLVEAQLPVEGALRVLVGKDEEDEALKIVESLLALFKEGHPDVEGTIGPSSCAILGRNRFVLLAVEDGLVAAGIPFFKRLGSSYENESDIVDDFYLGLRVVANPKDRLHLAALCKKWKAIDDSPGVDGMQTLTRLAEQSADADAAIVVGALTSIQNLGGRVNLASAFKSLRTFADGLEEASRLSIYEDVAVMEHEWDQYLRRGSGQQTLTGFLGAKALGSASRPSSSGVALLTVHAAKGLEFDIVFIAGMAEGTFPDYRARGKELLEERRNAFVAVTRSRRLLFLSYPATRRMPWGGLRNQSPSQFLL